MATRALTTLVTGLFDYAGLFPPAKLDMSKATENYARARVGAHPFMLGRFACPASKLHHLSEAASVLMPGTHATSGYREHADVLEPWSISAIMDCPLEESLELVEAFDEHHSVEEHGLARVDAVELRAKKPAFIDDALELIPDDVAPFFEIPLGEDCRGFVAALAGNNASGKIRCGGLTPDMIPKAEYIAAFMIACHGARVSFKTTAGLHHPLRAEHNLTYDPTSPRGTMHGFVNVFLAAALLQRFDASQDELVNLLDERDPDAFNWAPESVTWHDYTLDVVDIARTRQTFALSIGSCSFDEPVTDLAGLGWM